MLYIRFARAGQKSISNYTIAHSEIKKIIKFRPI